MACLFRCLRGPLGWLLGLAVVTAPARGHVVLPDNHDRTIQVSLGADPWTGRVDVRVEYRLEVSEDTAVFTDLAAVKSQLNLSEFRDRRDKFFQEFTRLYGPILGRNLDARLDGEELEFRCVQGEHRLRDEKGQVLGHLRCDFVFQAQARVRTAGPHRFFFREGNYQEGDKGFVHLSFAGRPPVRVLAVTAPDEALQARPAIDLKPGDDTRLRTVKATFTSPLLAPSGQPKQPVARKASAAAEARRASRESRKHPESARAEEKEAGHEEESGGPGNLLHWFLHSDQGLFLLLGGAALLGGLHALQPGHGKTLVAAYLVGERGTVWHALLLGLVTTLTHTGVVLILAAVLTAFFPRGMTAETRRGVQMGLGVVGGLIVALLGFWLLLRRLAGLADHFHFGGYGHHNHGPGGPHHHSHGPGGPDHDHDAHGHAHRLPQDLQLGGWRGLILLGISGGIVPCWEAIALLVATVGSNLIWLALPVLLAFSAGLAGVLVLIGVLVVKARGFAGSRWGESRLFRALPLLSAAAVAALGLWLCYHSVHAP